MARADAEKMLDQSVVGCQLSVQKKSNLDYFSKKKGWPTHFRGRQNFSRIDSN